MKKSLMSTMLFAAAFFVACTSNEEIAESRGGSGQDAIEIDVPVSLSDVPITFGAVGGVTRSSITADEMECKDLGIYCLARKGIDGTADKNLQWNMSSASTTNNQLCRWLTNEPAEIVWTGTASRLRWKNEEEGADEHFYPSATSSYKYAYTFAAYHPMISDEHIEIATNSIYLNFTNLDGSQDVFTSVTEAPTDEATVGIEGYGAAYFRNGGTKTPFFNLKHRLSQLIFNLKLNDTYTGDELWVDSIYITSLPDSVRIPLITFTKEQTTPVTVTINEPNYLYVHCTKTKTYYLRDFNDESLRKNYENYKLTTSSQQIGDCIMIPPMQPGYMKYNGVRWTNATAKQNLMTLKIRVRLRDIENNYYVYAASVAPPENGWKQGKKYNINLTITPKGATNIAMAAEAQLIDWEDDTDTFESNYDIGE